jgi:hypothetical protein
MHKILKPNLFTENLECFAESTRIFQGIPGIERGEDGTLWATWYSGGDNEGPDNYIVLARSDDNGLHWSDAVAVIKPGKIRAFDPCLWRAPNGQLWWFWSQSEMAIDGRLGVWAATITCPFGVISISKPVRIADGVMMNKPTVLSNGEWMLPIALWHSDFSGGFFGDRVNDPLKQDRKAHVYVTRDGRKFRYRGGVDVPKRSYDEHMVVERKDGSLVMYVRTTYGIAESVSTDGGKTWSVGVPSKIAGPGSRFFIRRLRSGRLLLVNHNQFTGRSHLTASLSDDDGASWYGHLLLDERVTVSYPDGVEAEDGTIYVIYDRERLGAGDILMSVFREEDVIAGQAQSSGCRLKQVVSTLHKRHLVAPGWDPVQAGARVLAGLVSITGPEVKGAHDAEMVMVDDKAYVVYEANDCQPGEDPHWDFVYVALSVVDVTTGKVEKIISIARPGQTYANEALPAGACFVPRIIQKDARTLRCYFASEAPGVRQAQTWYIDFDLKRQVFKKQIFRAKLKTASGVFDMQPQYFHADAAAKGFTKPACDYGLYIFDSFKVMDGKTYVVLNNYPGAQNALACLNEDLATFEIVGHYNEPQALRLTESAVNRLPFGPWMAIIRQDGGSHNYLFATSPDGRNWKPAEEQPFVVNGTSSKPTFDKIDGVYFLGWQDAATAQGAFRSVFNVDVSIDGKTWVRKYRFESDKSFQYPVFRKYRDSIYLVVTQGDDSDSRKEWIMFGKLE